MHGKKKKIKAAIRGKRDEKRIKKRMNTQRQNIFCLSLPNMNQSLFNAMS